MDVQPLFRDLLATEAVHFSIDRTVRFISGETAKSSSVLQAAYCHALYPIITQIVHRLFNPNGGNRANYRPGPLSRATFIVMGLCTLVSIGQGSGPRALSKELYLLLLTKPVSDLFQSFAATVYRNSPLFRPVARVLVADHELISHPRIREINLTLTEQNNHPYNRSWFKDWLRDMREAQVTTTQLTRRLMEMAPHGNQDWIAPLQAGALTCRLQEIERPTLQNLSQAVSTLLQGEINGNSVSDALKETAALSLLPPEWDKPIRILISHFDLIGEAPAFAPSASSISLPG